MPLRIIILALLLIGLFLLRYYQIRPFYPAGTRVKITATLYEEPVVTTNDFGKPQQQFKLAGIRLYAPAYPEYHYGDRLEAIGEVRQSQAGYWLKLDSLQEQNDSVLWLTALTGLRHRMENLIRSYLPEPECSLVAGMVLGSKNLPQDFFDHLKKSGTLHVVVASGANIALIAGPSLEILLLFLRRRTAAIATLFLIWFYVFLVGFDAPIVRAGIMGSLAFVALTLGKKSWAWWSLLISAVVMLFVKPGFITDVGFQLSFLSTAGILAFTRTFQKVFRFLPHFFLESWSTTLAAQIGTLPIMLFTFHQFQPLSPLVNAILLWTIPAITTLGILAILLGLLWYPLGQGSTYLIYPLAIYFVKIVSLF